MSHQYPDPGGYWDNNPGWQPADNTPFTNHASGGYPGQGGYGGYGGYGGQWGYPPPYPQVPPPDRTSTIWALVLGIFGFLACATNLVAIIFASIALSKDREPEEMRRFTRYAWISNGVHFGLIACLVIFFIVLIIVDP